MYKKFILLLLTLSVVLMLSGCELGKPTIPLTEKESDAIAQYCAHLLMKHGAASIYDERLMDKKDFEDAIEEREALLHPSPTPEPSPTPDPDEPAGTDIEGGQQDDNPGGETSGLLVDAPGELFDPERFEISVRDYSITESFLGEGEYFAISAPLDKEIVAINIEVKNITSQTQIFDYNDYSAKLNLALAVGETSSYAPEISLLANDLRYTKADIESGESFVGTVLFFVPDGSQDLVFRILGELKAYELNLNTTSEVENGY